MDKGATIWACCGPESQVADAAVAELEHGYGLPALGLEMINDSPGLDAQADIELATSGLWGMPAGVELVRNGSMIGLGRVVTGGGLRPGRRGHRLPARRVGAASAYPVGSRQGGFVW